jgi:hypothetical protein
MGFTRIKTGGFILALVLTAGCATYKATPVPFKTPAAYANAQLLDGAQVAAKAYADAAEAKTAFGFDVRSAGMLPVQVVFDNQGSHSLQIREGQTFLEDEEGNLWPILSSKLAYERATRYSKTKEVFKEGTYAGFLGAAAGGVVGAAIGIVTGDNVAEAAGKGAAIGAAAGATLGGAKGYSSEEARQAIVTDLQEKSLANQSISPGNLAHGFLFFPGEARSAKKLRLQVEEKDTGTLHQLLFNL